MSRIIAGRLVAWTTIIVGLASSGAAVAQDAPVDALLLGQWDGYDGVYSDLWSDGSYVYMGNWALGDGQPAQMFIVDITDPTNPTLAANYYFPFPNQFASPQEIMVVDGIAYVALEGDGNDGVAIIDVRDPAEPTLLATTRLEDYDDTHNIFFDNGFLYMCDSQTPRVGILDLRDFDPDNPPPSPITEATWILEGVGDSFVHEIMVYDNRLYCAAWDSGLQVYDVTNVATSVPTWKGSVSGSATHSMWVTDDSQYVVTGEERSNGGLKVYKITGTTFLHFTLTDSLTLSSDSFSVHNQNIIGYRLFSSWYQAGLQVHDIDPVTGDLVLRSSYDTSIFENTGDFSGAWGVFAFLGDDRVLVTDMQNGLHIIATKQDDCSPVEDCNANGNDDFCDLIEADSADCNHTLVPDECELDDGSSNDCQPDGIPDECQGDCNGNGVADACDISGGLSDDCQGNGVPDECETDCNANAIPDDCDLVAGTSLDCQPNGIPDECDVAAGPTVENLLLQLPNQANGFIADADDHLIFPPTTCAENFAVEYPTRLESVTIWGVYILADEPGTDEFTLTIRTDAGGVPGGVVYSESGIASTRQATGKILLGFWDEYKYVLTPADAIELDPDTYFVEIYNDTADTDDAFVWETATTGAIPGFAFSESVPATSWIYETTINLAIEISGPVIGADCNLNGDPDECDLADGDSTDTDGDGVPDECSACDGDVNGDGVVDPLDSGFVLARLGCPVDTGDASCNISDQSRDGIVDPLDVGYVLSRFGECP